MANCHKVFVNNCLYAIVHTLAQAEGLHFMLFDSDRGEELEVRIEPAFIEGVGF